MRFILRQIISLALFANMSAAAETHLAEAQARIKRIRAMLNDSVQSWELINDEFKDLDVYTLSGKAPLPNSMLNEISELRQQAEKKSPYKDTAENTTKAMGRYACSVAPAALDFHEGPTKLKKLTATIAEYLENGNASSEAVTRVLVGQALQGQSNQAQVKDWGRKLLDLCGSGKNRNDATCVQAKMAVQDPERFIRQFEKVKLWMHQQRYVEKANKSHNDVLESKTPVDVRFASKENSRLRNDCYAAASDPDKAKPLDAARTPPGMIKTAINTPAAR